jgi:hypothetical protein
VQLVFCAWLKAQVVRPIVRLPYPGLCTYSRYQTDVFSFIGNQAALADIEKPMFGLYGERRFLLDEMGMYQLAAAFPAGRGVFGLSATYSGFSGFNEALGGMAYAHRLGKNASLGLQVSHYSCRVPGIAQVGTIQVEAGGLIRVTPGLSLGLQFVNPAGGIPMKSGEKLPVVFRLGFGYDASEKFFVGGELVKEENQPLCLMTGFQYHIDRRFYARAGFSTSNTIGFLGFGWSWNGWRMDASASHHPYLGITPGLMMQAGIGNLK